MKPLSAFIIDRKMKNLGLTLREKREMLMLFLLLALCLLVSLMPVEAESSSSTLGPDSTRRRILGREGKKGPQAQPGQKASQEFGHLHLGQEPGQAIQAGQTNQSGQASQEPGQTSHPEQDSQQPGQASQPEQASQQPPAATDEESTTLSDNFDLLKERLSERLQPKQPPSSSAIVNLAPPLLKATLSLALVLAVIFGLSYLVKKYYLRGNLPGGKYIQLLDTCSLGLKNSLILVRVETQTLLLGLSGQQIVLLTQLNSVVGKSKSSEEAAKGRPKASESFAEQLSMNTLKLQPSLQVSESATNIADILESRLKGLKKV